MKAFLATLLFLAPALVRAETPNPADYTIPIHVQASTLISKCWSDNKGSACSTMQHLNVLIDGKKFELERAVDVNVFRIGDYKAKVVDEKKPRAEEYTRTYELLLSDGKTAKFAVVGESE